MIDPGTDPVVERVPAADGGGRAPAAGEMGTGDAEEATPAVSNGNAGGHVAPESAGNAADGPVGGAEAPRAAAVSADGGTEARTSQVKRTALFLRRHAPFDSFERAEVEAIARTVEIRRVAAGESVLVANGLPGRFLFVVREGTMELLFQGHVVDILTSGQAFGHPTLVTGLSPEFTVRAREESVLYLIPREIALTIFQSRPEGVEYLAYTLRDRLLRTARILRSIPETRTARVTTLIRRPPVFVEPDTPIRDVARVMSDEVVTCALVQTRDGIGMVTDEDLRRRVLAAGVSSESPVSSVMTLPVKTIGDDALAAEAGIAMMEAQIGHLPVVDTSGRVLGVVSAGALMTLDELSPFALRWSIAAAHGVDELVGIAGRLPTAFVTLVDARLEAPAIERVLTVMQDAMTTRLLEIAFDRHGEAPVPFAWLALGSGARGEVTLTSDQDNALAYADPPDPSVDAYFAAVAADVNDGLARCGFKLDESSVVASHHHWRMSESAWVGIFRQCLREWDFKYLQRATISFDFRHVTGTLPLVPALHQVMQEAPENPGFLRRLAGSVTALKSPLGFRQRLVGPVDLKKNALLPLENLARYHAFARGLTVTGTIDRFIAVGDLDPAESPSMATLREAFVSVAHLRLRHHANAIRRELPMDNVVDSTRLRPLSFATLQEALREITEATRRLPY